MPELSPQFQKMQPFYRFHFLEDGYPGRLDDDGSVFPHPIYGTYILTDYLSQYDRDPTPELREGIRRVASATIARMEEFHGALVFWYEAEPERGLRLYERHYSGLTQGYYAPVLHRAGELLDDKNIVDAAARVFDSLLLDAEDGGVKYNSPHGPMIAEVPQKPNSWILNGWQSAVAAVHRYAEVADSQRARNFVRANLRTMVAMLPRYDAPEYANSRYGLTGYVSLRLVFDDAVDRIGDVATVVPDEGTIEMPRLDGTVWQPSVSPDDVAPDGSLSDTTLHLNGVFSLASIAKPNRVNVEVESSRPSRVRLEAELGDYDPLASSAVNRTWTPVGEAQISPGSHTLSFPIEKGVIERVVSPTNFAKKIEDEQVNVYHRIHTFRLAMLAGLPGGEDLLPWSEKFSSYVCDWSGDERYAGLKIHGPNQGDALGDPSLWC